MSKLESFIAEIDAHLSNLYELSGIYNKTATMLNSCKVIINIQAEALELISSYKSFTRLADCCVDKTCHINTDSKTCSFQTGVNYGNSDRAGEADIAIADVEEILEKSK